jgi:hypothetical protein
VVRAPSYEDFLLDYIQVKWQVDDKRQIHGPYGEPAATE